MSNAQLLPSSGLLNDHRIRPGLIVCLGAWAVLTYMAGVTNAWTATPDSSLYMGLGRSLAEGQGYVFNGEVCTDVGPGLPLILAGLQRLFGDVFWPANLLMALFALAAAVAIYKALIQMTDKATATTVAVITVLSYSFFEWGHRILTDMPFLTMMWWAIAVVLRERSPLWRVLTGTVALSCVAIIIRVPGVLAIGAVSLGLVLGAVPGRPLGGRILRGCALLIPAALASGAFFLWTASVTNHKALYARIATRHEALDLGRVADDVSQGLCLLPKAVGKSLLGDDETFYVFAGGVLILLIALGAVVLWRRGRRLAGTAMVVFLPAMVLVGGGVRAIQERYLLPVMPLMAWCTIEGVCACASFVASRYGRNPARWAVAAATGLAVLVIAINQPLTVREAFYWSYLAHTGQQNRVPNYVKYADLVAAAKPVIERTPPDAVIALSGEEWRFLHYITRRRVVRLVSQPWQKRSFTPEQAREAEMTTPAMVLYDVGHATEKQKDQLLRDLSGRYKLELATRYYRVFGPEAAPGTGDNR